MDVSVGSCHCCLANKGIQKLFPTAVLCVKLILALVDATTTKQWVGIWSQKLLKLWVKEGQERM